MSQVSGVSQGPGPIPDVARDRLAASFVRPASAAQRVADALREQIVDGGLAPGTQLVEESLATGIGVSRNTVREACAQLTAERIVERVPNRGVFVASPGRAEVADLYRTRMLLEPAAVRWGAPASADFLARLRAAVDRGRACRDIGDWAGAAMANQQFHHELVALGGSRRVQELFASVLAEMRLVFHRTGDGAFHGPYVDDNDRVITLLEQGRRDEAADHLVDYLTRARDDLLARLDG